MVRVSLAQFLLCAPLRKRKAYQRQVGVEGLLGRDAEKQGAMLLSLGSLELTIQIHVLS